MSRNGSGTYSIPNTLVAGATITAAGLNQNFTDIGTEITGSLAIDGQSTMTGQTKNAAGTAAAPSITFGSDLDTGFYRRAANSIGVALAGADYIEIATASCSIGPAVSFGSTVRAVGQILAADGSSASAAIAFATAPNIGFYKRTGVTSLNILIGDKDIFEIATASASIGQAVAVASLRSVAGVTAAGAINGATAAGAMVATQAQQETGTATDLLVTPGRQHFNPLHPKAWCNFNGSGTPAVAVGAGVSSITDNGVGEYAVNWTTVFSTANYGSLATASTSAAGGTMLIALDRTGSALVAPTAAAQAIQVFAYSNGALTDISRIYIAAFGDFA